MPAETSWDVIVVGAGTAGLPCAIAATEAGAHVLVVEKADAVGGTLHAVGHSIAAAGARRGSDQGIVDSPDEHFADVMRIGLNAADRDLVRLVVDEAPAAVDWLDDLAAVFDPETPSLDDPNEPYSAPRLYWGRLKRSRWLLDAISARFWALVDLGEITVLLDHALAGLLVGEERVVGIEVDGPDAHYEIHGTSVVLATGGYGSSPELFSELTPGGPQLVSMSWPTSTGDGLVAARAIGAAVRNRDVYMPTPGALETEPGSHRTAEKESARLTAHYRAPREIHVNARGERFLAEDNTSASRLVEAALAQPGHAIWLVFDEEALAHPDPLWHNMWNADEIRRRAASGGPVWAADDLRELARKAGIDPDGLARTVANWNTAVATGHDPLGRAAPTHPVATPPFYAAVTYPATITTAAGLTVDAQLRVVREDGTAIPGLYAVGEILGAGATMGRVKSAGMMITQAIACGRYLGRTLGAGG